MLAFFENNDATKTVLMWVAIAAVALAIIALVVKLILMARHSKAAKKANGELTEQQAKDELLEEQTYLEVNERGYIVMSRNVIQSVGIDGKIRAGKYELESADDTNGKFNVRVNGLVKEYGNGDKLVLTDGDTISPVSGAVMLKQSEE